MRLSWARVATWAIAFVVGAAYGTAGTIAHAFTIGPVPLGLVLVGWLVRLASVLVLAGLAVKLGFGDWLK